MVEWQTRYLEVVVSDARVGSSPVICTKTKALSKDRAFVFTNSEWGKPRFFYNAISHLITFQPKALAIKKLKAGFGVFLFILIDTKGFSVYNCM